MYIRTTRFQAKKASIGKFKELAEYARARTTTLDGLLSNYIAIDESGKGLMIGIWESREKLAASLPAIKANWAGVAEHLDGDPVTDEYPSVVKVKG
jgi:quinol monooxygenase YgiN